MTFDERVEHEPRAVIDDLLAQIARQARALHEKNKDKGLPEDDGVEPLGAMAVERGLGLPVKKPRKSRAKKSEPAPQEIDNEGVPVGE